MFHRSRQMFLALFFLFIQVPLFVTTDVDDNCDYKKPQTQKCFFDFFKLFNLSTIPVFEDFTNILSQIQDKDGWDGEEYICNNGMILVNCINKNGITLTPECFSYIFNADTDDSIGHVTNFYLMQYRCQGKGYKEFKDTYNCSKTMKGCNGKTDSCFAMKKFIECMKEQATEKCGPEYSDFLANSLQILVNVSYNSCLPPTPSAPSKPSNSNSTLLLTVIAFAILTALIIGAAIITKCRHLKKKKKERQDIYRMTTAIPQQSTPFYNNLFIPDTKISIDFDKILGQGSTATVYAVAINEQSKSISTKQIALKIPIHKRLDYFEEFKHELKIATILKNHSTICSAINWTLYRELPCLIFVKMDIDLLSFVKAYNEPEKAAEFPPTKLFLQFLWQISDALCFIASKNLVHRDVAARNILIAYPNIAKISDFGLCSEFDALTSVYLSPMFKKLPVKWLPPEALIERKFSEKSDIWSFGITVYEMWTKGELPYGEMNYAEQMEFLQSGQRLGIPVEMREDIGEIMLSCWNVEQEMRPTFERIKESFENLLEKETINYGYLSYDETEK